VATLNTRLHSAFHEPNTRVYRVVQGSVWALIVLSIVLLVVEAFLPGGSPAREALDHVDRVVLALFAVELILRVYSFQPPSIKVFKRRKIGQLRVHLLARLGFMFRPLILVDLLAVLAFFPELRGLRALRLLRLLRTSRVFRYHNPFAIIMQALEENGLLFAFAFSVLGVTTTLGGVSMYLVEADANPSINNVLDGIWWALVTITTVGFGDITPVTLLGRIVGAVLMVAGLFTLALFAGIVGSSLVRGMLSIREEQFRMSEYVNHVVVCGYDESTDLLLGALTQELDLTETRVVLFDDEERPRSLPPEFLWVQGDPSKESELDKVRLSHARAVIVSGARDTNPQDADARTILTLFTIRSFLSRQTKMRLRRFPLYVVAEILDSENVDHAITAGADEVIETRKIGFSMIAHAVGFHGTATTMSRVLISGEHSVYIGRIPDAPREPVRFGDLLVKMQLSKRGGLVVGLRPPSGKEMINPPKDYLVAPGTLLIYLAESPLLKPPR
jgi:voltage-gated potassium channel Kch